MYETIYALPPISHSNSQGSINPFGSGIVLLQIQYTVMTMMTAGATR